MAILILPEDNIAIGEAFGKLLRQDHKYKALNQIHEFVKLTKSSASEAVKLGLSNLTSLKWSTKIFKTSWQL